MAAACPGEFPGRHSHSTPGTTVVTPSSRSPLEISTLVTTIVATHSISYTAIRCKTAKTYSGKKSNSTSGEILCNTSSTGTSSLSLSATSGKRPATSDQHYVVQQCSYPLSTTNYHPHTSLQHPRQLLSAILLIYLRPPRHYLTAPITFILNPALGH